MSLGLFLVLRRARCQSFSEVIYAEGRNRIFTSAGKNLFFHTIYIIKLLLQASLASTYSVWDNSLSGLTGTFKLWCHSCTETVLMSVLALQRVIRQRWHGVCVITRFCWSSLCFQGGTWSWGKKKRKGKYQMFHFPDFISCAFRQTRLITFLMSK